MKLRNFAIGLIFLFSMPAARAQVFEMYYQGFESTETVQFTATPTDGVVYDSQLKVSGDRSIKLVQSTANAISLVTDTIDFSQNTTLHYVALEFDHICNAATNGGGDVVVGKIYAKRPSQSAWTALTSNHYNTTYGGSPEFGPTGSFSRESYSEWSTSTMTNDYWKSERFDLDQFMGTGVAANERKLIIKFELVRKLNGNPNGAGWWIDNLRIRASQNQMITPTIVMRCYPDGGAHPSSRGGKIILDARTTVSQGICADSVYVTYTVGSDPTQIRLPMTSLGFITGNDNLTYTRFTCRVPFEGYDTTMRFFCTVKDNTTNFNEATFPSTANTWVEYHCVRGSAQPGTLTDGFTSTSSSNMFPFPPCADAKSEWVYDSALLAQAGYGPGSILSMRYTVMANNSLQTRPKFQIKMKNIPTSYTQNPSGEYVDFMADYMHVVYDSTLVIDEVGAGVERTINLQDTFFYAGKDILVQMIYDGTTDPGATAIRTIGAPSNKKTIFFYGALSVFGYNAYTAENFTRSTAVSAQRPSFVMTSVENPALVNDMGISAFSFPNETNPIVTQPSYVDVVLKNYGLSTVNAIRISYTIDDTIPGYYDWTGVLAGSAEATVRVATGVTLPAGYHYVRAWVEDTMTVGTQQLRDPEPYNDTMLAEFIVCDGPMSGVRHIGGTNADYNTIEEFLFSLSQCGVDDSLVVYIAGGEYAPLTIPTVPGISSDNYVVFQPESGATVTIKANGVASNIVNMEASPYIRLRGLNMVRTSGELSNMVLMGENSTGCRVENCTLIDSLENPTSSLRIGAMINSGFANDIVVSNNVIRGGNIGINLEGQASDTRSSHNTAYHNTLYGQYSSAIAVTNQSAALVEKNEMYDVLSNASYVLRVMNCYDTARFLSNKIYTSHGAQAVGVNNIIGTSSVHALIANNMVVCADDGTANLQNTPFNIIAGQWVDVVYNSVKMTAPMRNNVAAATFGGGVLANSRFLNNIVACFDSYNYALNFAPGNQTTNTVAHNVYYSEGSVLNKRSGNTYANLTAWQQVMTADTNSVSVNPMFLNGSLVDLRTFNRLVKGVGTPLSNVTTDMFYTIRNATAPCAGAFEFVSLFYDYEVEALFNPEADNCDMPDYVELVIGIRNSGVNPYVPGGTVSLSGAYSINGTSAQPFAINRTVPAEDTIVYSTGAMVHLPVNGIYDSVYHIKIWTICPSDPNQTNDTNTFTVISRYHSEAPANTTNYTAYNTADTLEATGITQWAIYNASDAPTKPSIVYWYYSPDDEEPFLTGTTYITDTLRQDTAFYLRQKRHLPIVRITQVQIFSADTVVGLTDPMPEWIHANAKVVVQLTNVGDDTAHLDNDTLLFVSPTNSYNNKLFRFATVSGGVTIAPGASLAVQFTQSAMANQLPYMLRANVAFAPLYTTNFGLIYRSSGIQDAVAFNSVTTATQWTNLNVPSYVWSGTGVSLTDNIHAGVIRQAFNGDSGDWSIATEDNPMHLASVDESWLRYTANNCEGDVGTATVIISAPPVADIELAAEPLSAGCGLSEQPVSVRVHNFGTNAVSNLQLNYAARGTSVSETLTSPIASSGDTVYTFSVPLNMLTDQDTLVEVVIWATAVTGDPLSSNDTSVTYVLASHTPDMPVFVDTIYFDYASSDTLALATDSLHYPVWYDYNGNAVDTGNAYITDILYSEGVMGVSLLHQKDSAVHIGSFASLSTKNAYPSPYQPKSLQSKQQYIYTAHELRSMGMKPGAITGIAFHLDSIYKVNNTTQRDSVVFNGFDIYLGLTTDTIFANTTAWKTTQQVYSRTNMPIYRSQSHGWVNHQLDTPFNWDGTQSLVVQVVTNISPVISTGVQTAYTAKANTVLSKDGNSVGAAYTDAGTKGGNRPDINITGKVDGCEGPVKYFNIALNGISDTDATVCMPEGSDTIVYNSCGNIAMQVLMRNMGNNAISGYRLLYSIDGAAMDTTVVTNTIVSGAEDLVQLFSRHLVPGHHSVVAIVDVDGDSVQSNDTVRTSFNVRFCGGTYTIGADSVYDYHTFGEAIDSMAVAGIDGPVVFRVAAGVYQEQVLLDSIDGSSVQNTITFRGPADSSATIVAAGTAQANYVVNVNGLSNIVFDSLQMLSRPTGNTNYAHVLVLQNTSNVNVTNSVLRVKGTVHNQNGSCVMLQGNVSQLRMYDNIIDSGYYSVSYVNNTTGYSDFTFQNNTMSNFNLGAIGLKGVSSVNITRNTMTSSYRGKMTGIALENVDSVVMIQKNKIYLLGALTGGNNVIDAFGKRGIDLKNVSGTNLRWAYVINNMISASSNGVSGADPTGIYLDGTCSYVDVYYNTVRVYAGASDVTKSKAFFCGAQTNHLQIMNNIFSNFSGAYAYYVTSSSNITSSDYNDYYAAGSKFAYWGGSDRNDLSELQTAGSRDGSSLNEEPYFLGVDDLHLAMTNFVSRAQYNTDVIDDIDDTIRSQMPAPTIGAHEMTRLNHNMSVVRIISPYMPVDTTFPNNATPPNIESDSVLVKASFYNNGNATETNVRWYAYIEGYESTTSSAIRSLGTFISAQMKTDSVWMPTTLGIINTKNVKVVILMNSTDDDTSDNHMNAQFYLAPAFDIEAVRLTVPSGCSLQQSTIGITIKNAGFKEIPAGVQFEMGYHAQGYYPNIQSNLNNNQVQISTMPDTVRETQTFATALSRNSSRDFTFNTQANLYPTDTAINIKVRVNGWCHYIYDVTQSNDSTRTASSSSPQVDSWYTPDAPVGHDTSFAYGTWGEVTAEQLTAHGPSSLTGRPIRWYRDSTASPFYSPNNYNSSKKWSTTPQYFHDSTYYLQSFSDKNCPSRFSEVHVTVRPRVPVDMGLDGRILAPLGNRVYMENDTVRVVVVNFGTQSQTNIPVAFELRRGNNTNPIQTVHDTIRTTIGPGGELTYTFSTLIQFASATQSGNYQLRVWTEMPGDTIHRNDTIRWVQQLRSSSVNNTALDYPFSARGDSYSYRTNAYDDSYDFTYLAYNDISVDLPPIGRLFTNFGAFGNPEYPVLHVTRGTTDSLVFSIVKSDDPAARSRAKAAVYIDFDRSGNFEDNADEIVVAPQQVSTLDRYALPVTISPTASLGYMRMRFVTSKYEDEPNSTLLTSGGDTKQGHIVDFLLFVDPEPPANDLAFTQIVYPRSRLILEDDSIAVTFRVANKGASPVTRFNVHYNYIADTIDSTCSGSFQWTGVLMPGTSTVVTLPSHHFTIGTTTLQIWHDFDTILTNNMLTYEYHRFHTVTLRINESFDSVDHKNYWYAPTGYNRYTYNFWQLGTPNKSNIQGAYSDPNAWVTDTISVVTTGRRGSVSYLYSPIIDIGQIKSDTISFRLLRNLTNGSTLKLEFYNYANQWQNVYHDSILTGWYNDVDEQAFNGSSPGGAYNRYWVSTHKYLSGDFREKFLFRFVYTTPQGANDNASFGDGCAIDDFCVGRAQRSMDLGVVAITEPVQPKYGQTIYPKVVVHNYGYDTVRGIEVGYTHYGTNLPKLSSFPAAVIAPGEDDTLLCTSSFIITSDYPDTFDINAFTILSSDIYYDNDTTSVSFALSPLDNDISAEEFVSPLERVIAGDSTISVTFRIRNFGTNSIPSATLTYIVNDNYVVTESVNFTEVMGRPLMSTEYFNYTFRKHFQASMGAMRLVGIVQCDSNEYIYNDTIEKRINGISSITDIAASSIVVDTSRRDDVKVSLIIDNRGARGANGFEVGFWIDNDTSTIYRTTYSSSLPIPALTSGYILFDTSMQARAAPYNYVTAYVRIADDNDRSNDTTSTLVPKYVDLEAVEIVVVENSAPDCNVYLRMRNRGNTAFNRAMSFSATVNGNELSVRSTPNVQPMATTLVPFNRTIPKDQMSRYVGTGTVTYSADSNATNDQTNIVSVVSYLEGIPEVSAGKLTLDQNYPNPFSGQTTIPFSLPNSAEVRWFVMDALGHIVMGSHGWFQAGANTIELEMSRFSTGVYYYGIEVDGQRQMRKMVLR